jgi:LytS/YehU family sensor histidine kinase
MPSLLRSHWVWIGSCVSENAIKHGLEQRRGRGMVAVQAERSGELLSLCVRNEADSSMEEQAQPGFGLGLESTRERLAHLYGTSGFQLELIQSSQGSVARMQIPFVLQEA